MKWSVDPELLPYWRFRDRLTLYEGLILYDNRIVVPPSLQDETLEKIHEGHQGIERCRMRANSCNWWPGMSQSIVRKVQNCQICAKDYVPRREPLIVTPLPEYPWQMIGTDLFEIAGEHYLLAEG